MPMQQLGDGNPDGLQVPNVPFAFYGKTPVAARASASSHQTSVISASSYITVATNLAAFALDVSSTLIGLGIWS